MTQSRLQLLAVVLALSVMCAAADKYPQEAYGYIQVNKTAQSSMFYALLGDHDETVRKNAPLVMWLQGGPGASSLFGDFLETGPLELRVYKSTQKTYLVNRTTTWTKHANMLYVDNPVGTGFSYSFTPGGFSTTDEEIADNLFAFLEGFISTHTEFFLHDFWIFSESYGGKMAAFFGAKLVEMMEKGTVLVSFKGVALGDGWLSPVDCMKSYGDYLLGLSELNPNEAMKASKYADYAQDALEAGDGKTATQYWRAQQESISIFTDGIGWYNVLPTSQSVPEDALDEYLKTNFTKKLGDVVPPNVTYGGQGGEVFSRLNEAFMKDGIEKVLFLLDKNVTVNVFSGQLDLIVDVLCTRRWIQKLDWDDLDSFLVAPRVPLYPGGRSDYSVGAFVQQYKNFAFWEILLAGHMLPFDEPHMMETVFASIVGGNMTKIDVPNAQLQETESDRFVPRIRNLQRLYKP